jgi:hypothetical protein
MPCKIAVGFGAFDPYKGALLSHQGTSATDQRPNMPHRPMCPLDVRILRRCSDLKLT